MWHRASKHDLLYVVEPSTDYLLICSPFLSRYGVRLLFDAMPNRAGLKTIEVWTRISTGNVLEHPTDPAALKILRDEATRIGARFPVHTHRLLHAKVIVTNKRAIAGSANLTHQGYESGMELVRRIEGDEIGEIYTALVDIAGALSKVSESDLEAFFLLNLDSARSRQLDPVEPSDDEKESVVPSPPLFSGASHEDFLRFVARLSEYDTGAQALLEVIKGQSRSGHVEQSFWALLQFFRQFPEYYGASQRYVEEVGGEIFPLAPTTRRHEGLDWLNDLAEEWRRFVQTGAGKFCDYLYRHMGSSYGGDPERSGGGAGTALIRAWPLVTRYLTQLGQ